jgi:exopolysaccharide/PEP-CTERM locus tyrosine autokinase
MSRLEKALEKATNMRKEKRETAKEEKLDSLANVEVFKTDEPVKIDSPYIITVTEPESPISEEYRKLKTLVIKLTQSDRSMNTIMITSAVKGEGKTITTLNFAITLAQEYDHTVLLVDADLREPSLHEYLGVNPEKGLTDCLVNGTNISDALIKTGIGRLVYLPSGNKVSNPVELLSSKLMEEFVKELKNRYPDRYVIFDVPPVLAFGETHSLGSMVDGVILVVREGYTSLNHIKEALGRLKNTHIFGVVYNDVVIDRFDGHYNYYYKNYYPREKRKPDEPDKSFGK